MTPEFILYAICTGAFLIGFLCGAIIGVGVAASYLK